MRDLQVNLSTVYYAMYVGYMEGIKDGKPTGQPAPQFTIPRQSAACVSTPLGTTENTPFGAFTDYDKIMTTANEDFKADEHSVLWIDAMPVIKPDGSTDTPYDYTVEKLAEWGGQKAYAIKKRVNSIDDSEYLKHLLNSEAISQSEYDFYIKRLVTDEN